MSVIIPTTLVCVLFTSAIFFYTCLVLLFLSEQMILHTIVFPSIRVWLVGLCEYIPADILRGVVTKVSN